jgi:hypothetical protein
MRKTDYEEEEEDELYFVGIQPFWVFSSWKSQARAWAQ